MHILAEKVNCTLKAVVEFGERNSYQPARWSETGELDMRMKPQPAVDCHQHAGAHHAR
jgi:hypothetical protein